MLLATTDSSIAAVGWGLPIPRLASKSSQGISLRHPLVLMTIVAIVGAIAALGFSAAMSAGGLSTSLLSNIIVFLGSGLLSYFITYSNDRRQFLEEMEKLADFSRRRVDLLSESLLSLAEEVRNVPTAEEAKRIVIYTLRNLEQDARASVRDIETMGGIEIKDVKPGSVSEPEAPATVEPSIEDDRPTEDGRPAEEDGITVYTCPSCGLSNETVLDSFPGATRHTSCSNCQAPLTLHRRKGGGHRVVNPPNPLHRRLSDYATGIPVRNSTPDILESFECPRCQTRITFKVPKDQRIVEKPCFACLAVSSYDRVLNKTTLRSEKRPEYLDSIDLKEMDCAVCNAHFVPHKFITRNAAREGVDAPKEFICCFACNTIYLSERDRKRPVMRACPTTNCGNEVTFRISEAESETRQFCLECKSRLLYRRAEDVVSLIETLQVPRLAYKDFEENGKRCPHCGQAASGRTMANRRGEKLSICWNCKNVFQLV